jgi:cystathionine beta-synthase
MKYYNNVLETIGNTPLIKLNKVTAGIKATVLAKVDSYNPGNSIKDRIAVKMVEVAEKEGKLKPGGTIIEGTSGNTGMGLALVAIAKGYKCIFTTNDKQSKEKIDILKAVGADVIVCPTNVAANDPRSYYSVARKLSKEIPNSFYVNQYDNLANRLAHYESTGPEIWEATEGKITHLVVGAGTGGTICGTGKYLKEKNPDIKIWGIDTYGSTLKAFHETGKINEEEIYAYITEGIGEDIIPENYDFSVIDHFEKVTDKDGAILAREITKKEGIFVGYSAGSAIAGLLQLKDKLTEKDVVVVIFHDHGSRYVGKLYNDEWMKERGFLEKTRPTAFEIIKTNGKRELIYANSDEKISSVIDKMKKNDISQIPVMEADKMVGSLDDGILFSKLLESTTVLNEPAKNLMQKPFPVVELNTTLEEISSKFTKENGAVVVKDTDNHLHIITKHDVIGAIR